jgi:poly(3-hydroxybutyrate) depolymerase
MSPGPTGNRLASVGDDALRAARSHKIEAGKCLYHFSAGNRIRGLLAAPFSLLLILWLSGTAAAATGVRTLDFSYPSHTGAARTAYLVLPAWYGPRRHPPIPLVISPHGRGVSGAYNLRFWGALPARGPFAVVSPDGQGRRLPFYSWGYAGQIDDLALMPAFARRALPWLRIDARRVYAIGDSMGAQEVLLLLARAKLRLAGVAAFDPVTDMAIRYRTWFTTPGEQSLPAKARVEFGGTPSQLPRAYAARSPASQLAAFARSRVPLQLWWSHRDAVITDQARQTAEFYARLHALAPSAPVREIVGWWQHAHAMHPDTQLPAALACFGLVPSAGLRVPAYEERPDGSIEELRARATVDFGRAFCGRSTGA